MWPKLAAIGAAILGIFGWIAWSRSKSAEKVPKGESITGPVETLDDLYRKHASKKGLDWKLVKAVAIVESNENPNAKNPADPSLGLMQVLCVPDGRGGCANNLNVRDWPPESAKRLYDPDYNLHIACQILRWNIDTYGLWKGVAVYNSWSARHDPANGPFRNQEYVNKVRREYNSI